MSVLVKAKQRLKTVKSLNSIFNALQVITIARLQKIRARHGVAQRYLLEMRKIADQMDFSHIYEGEGRRASKGLALLISGNRGFCGAFNQNILYRAGNFIKETGAGTEYIALGRKGLEFLRARKQSVKEAYLAEDYGFSFFSDLTAKVIKRYLAGEIGQVHLLFNRFRTVMRQDAVANRVVPAERPSVPGHDRYIIEPDKRQAAETVFEKLLAAEMYFSYLDSQLGEVSARMFTLKGAIENSEELIGNLAVTLNKARQQSITQELLEIIASAESLKEGKD